MGNHDNSFFFSFRDGGKGGGGGLRHCTAVIIGRLQGFCRCTYLSPTPVHSQVKRVGSNTVTWAAVELPPLTDHELTDLLFFTISLCLLASVSRGDEEKVSRLSGGPKIKVQTPLWLHLKGIREWRF